MTDRLLDELARNFEQSWSRKTSADPDHWSLDNPAYGQCAVTALVVQDRLGGELLRARVNGVSHYWNRLPSGDEIDFTRQQFSGISDFPRGEIKSRDFVLSFPDTLERYLSLRQALGLGSATEVAQSDR